jgi:peptidoglycan hydrolase-like amidase
VADLTRELGYRQAAAGQDREIITRIAEESINLEAEQKKQSERKNQLASLQTQLDRQAAPLRKAVLEAKRYQAQLSGKIAELSARQKAILSEKAETFQTTVGDVPLADDPASRPDYNPGFSPAFAVFSFGAPHFKGMSQYGAFGRAKSGQSAEDILKAYYGGGIEIKKDYSTNININVRGYGTVDLETYAKRIYEMPGSWGDEGGMEALKAQAVAARSYALAYTNNGAGSICATEACQVYKPSNKGGKWEEAVNSTRGWVLIANGKPFSAWYASTSGGYQESYSSNGYSTSGFWDTKSGRGGWTGEAYEKIAASPWFYKGWYRSRSGDACGRSHPWLTAEEMADILNAWAVLVKSGQKDDRVMPMGGCWGGNPYSIDELRSRSESAGGGFKQVRGISVTYAENGVTSSVNFDTDKGSVNIPGSEFKKAFNLRAPGRIALKSGLFNVEKK